MGVAVCQCLLYVPRRRLVAAKVSVSILPLGSILFYFYVLLKSFLLFFFFNENEAMRAACQKMLINYSRKTQKLHN